MYEKLDKTEINDRLDSEQKGICNNSMAKNSPEEKESDE